MAHKAVRSSGSNRAHRRQDGKATTQRVYGKQGQKGSGAAYDSANRSPRRRSNRYRLERKDIIQRYESDPDFQGISGREPRWMPRREQNGTLNIQRDIKPDRWISLMHCVMPREERKSDGDRHPKEIQSSVYDDR